MRQVTSLVLVAAASLVAATTTWAHGDPASDFLLTQNVFLPPKTKIDVAVRKELETVLVNANASGFEIRVALILSPADLGTAFSLFGKPQRYAELLGSELGPAYRDRLLVVMPGGYGYSHGNPDPSAARVLAALPAPGKDATKEARAATLAVRRLAAAAGVKIKPRAGRGSATRDRIMIAAAALALAAGLASVRRRRARTRLA